jgi:23S rRNA pseudouridine1911/1915/1917 synthase
MALNRGHSYALHVGPREAGATLVELLAARFSHSPVEEWALRCGRGELMIAGCCVDAERRLLKGETVVWNRPPWDEPDVPLEFEVLHEDDALLVVDKPSGLPTVPAGGFLEHTLLTLVRRSRPEATPMHRLGRGTSGVVLFARTTEAAARLQAEWRERRVRKVYRALMTGLPEWDARRIDVPIGPMFHDALGELHAASPSGKRAISEVRVLGRREGHALVEVEIETGRPHQIRIHLAAVGHPLVGDPLYVAGGVPAPQSRVLPGETGYWLHAHTLEVTHPATGERAAFTAPPPSILSL